jgi:hypothetical protein
MRHADLVAALEPYRDDGDEDVEHLHPVLAFRLAGAFWASQLMRDHVRIESGARSMDAQRHLYARWRNGQGNLAADPDRKIAPGFVGSYHMIQPADSYAWACDLTRIGPVSWSQVHEVLDAWGLERTVPGEDWHVQAGRHTGMFAGPMPPESVWKADTAPYRPLRLRRPRMRGPYVKWVQERCAAVPDSVFGPATADAVADWQANHGLTADGVVGPKTHQALEEGST